MSLDVEFPESRFSCLCDPGWLRIVVVVAGGVLIALIAAVLGFFSVSAEVESISLDSSELLNYGGRATGSLPGSSCF